MVSLTPVELTLISKPGHMEDAISLAQHEIWNSSCVTRRYCMKKKRVLVWVRKYKCISL